MTSFEIIALVVSGIGVICFAVIFTILYSSYASSAISELKSGQRDAELIEDTIYRNASNEKRINRVYAKVKQVLSIFLITVMSIFLVLSVISKLQNGVVMFFDRGAIAIATGSMSEKHKDNSYLKDPKLNNQFDAYDIIILEKVKRAEDIKKYDVISFVNDEGINVIHRVINIEHTARGVVFTTRGDSNNATDTYKPTFDDVVGRYTGERIPLVGLFALFLQSYSGMVTIAAIIYCLIMIDRIGDKINRHEVERIEMLSSSIEFKREVAIEEGEVATSFVESVRYKDHIYVFDENGFVEKRQLPKTDPAPSESDSAESTKKGDAMPKVENEEPKEQKTN
ncbi:MAG: signal peptidase I [Clostridia bacterium]|nr:signal peptidase I [Clostridia bacterium]